VNGDPSTPHSLERQVERLADQVQRLEREKADIEAFAAVAAHELFEPLVMIEAYASMASERLDVAEHAASRADLDEISRAASRLRRQVETILHDARTSGSPLVKQDVDCNRLVADVVALLRPEIEARGTRIDAGDLPRVRGEEALLRGLFTNLIGNALKYGPRRGGRISISAEREPRHWRLSIHDDGTPITDDERADIFEPFRRGRRERRARGAGLGLTICRRIVERHGGSIGVAAGGALGGNAFFFTLPI
jgi:signal transduction histidine kinase